MRLADATDTLMWTRHLELLKVGVRGRSPDGIDRVRREVRRREQELGPLASRLAIMAAKERVGVPVDLGAAETIRARVDVLQKELQDLRATQKRESNAARARSRPHG